MSLKEITSNLVRKFAFPKPLPTKRNSVMRKVIVDNNKVFLGTGDFKDGTLGEIFIDMHKEGTAIRALFNCLAIAVSVGLQHGVPLEIYVDYFADMKFEPNGIVRDYDRIKYADSIVGLIFRILAIEYLGMEEYADEPKEEEQMVCQICTEPNEEVTEENVDTISSVDEHNKSMMGDAPFCIDCGHITVRSGTCFKCLNCGSTSGCS